MGLRTCLVKGELGIQRLFGVRIATRNDGGGVSRRFQGKVIASALQDARSGEEGPAVGDFFVLMKGRAAEAISMSERRMGCLSQIRSQRQEMASPAMGLRACLAKGETRIQKAVWNPYRGSQ